MRESDKVSKKMLLLLGLLLVLYLATLWRGLDAPLATDFTKFYASATHYLNGTSIYAPLDTARFVAASSSASEIVAIHPNLNPPFVTLLLLPLSWLSWKAAYIYWTLASLASGLAAMHFLTRELGLPTSWPVQTKSWTLLLLFYPTWATIQFGQVSLFIFLLVTLLWCALRTERDTRAGLLLGFLMAVKLFTGLFLLLLLIRSRVKAASIAVLTVTATWAVSLVAFGPGVAADYGDALSRVTWTGASWNASLQGFCNRIWGGSEGPALWEAPQAGRIVATGLAVLLALLFVALARRRDPETLDHMDLSFALVLPLMLLLSPLGWMYYFPLLLLPAALLWKRGRELAAGLFFLLATLPFPFMQAGSIDTLADYFIYSGVYFYALCWLAFALFRELRSKG